MKTTIVKSAIVSCLVCLTAGAGAYAQPAAAPGISKVWLPSAGDGTYRNPIIHADYSDPDVVAVGGDFYMTASSFNCVPGLPILHSKDLVHWQIVNYAIESLEPAEFFASPRHGKGVWAPSIRFHDGEFYIYWGDPDHGIYMVKAADPRGKWSQPHLVRAGKGMIDTTPLWDDDGRAYLVNGWAGSRAGFNSVLTVWEMTPDGRELTGAPVLVFDGNDGVNKTVEGPKFYKRDGWYYILAPAGGVSTGWQLAMRSRSPYGPYESRIVMAQGTTDINGPHQGGMVETPAGESWFVHFQDKGAYGRVVHLNPVGWRDGWPVIGSDPDGDGCGQPVTRHRMPDVGARYAACTPQESDEFDSHTPGLQWQWHANYHPTFGMTSGAGYMRIYGHPVAKDSVNLWEVPNLLLQKFPAPAFTATARLKVSAKAEGSQAGLTVMGNDYARLTVESRGEGFALLLYTCRNAEKGAREEVREVAAIDAVRHYGEGTYLTHECEVYLQVTVGEGGLCTFAYSTDGKRFRKVGGEPFTAAPGKWIGAKVGLFAIQPEGVDRCWADADWFRIGR